MSERPLTLLDRFRGAPRLETKFELPHVDFGKIDSILKVNNRAVRYVGEESVVNSIYFDDHALRSYRESAEGIGDRYKLRLRWYDAPLPGTHACFEVKRRVGYSINKDRFMLETDVPFGEMSYREIVSSLIAVLPEAPGELLRLRPEPIVLVSYRRRYYDADGVGAVRLTLDRNIVSYEQLGAARPVRRFPSPIYARLVLELKSPSADLLDARPLLGPLRPRQTRFSKYLLCCQSISLAEVSGA